MSKFGPVIPTKEFIALFGRGGWIATGGGYFTPHPHGRVVCDLLDTVEEDKGKLYLSFSTERGPQRCAAHLPEGSFCVTRPAPHLIYVVRICLQKRKIKGGGGEYETPVLGIYLKLFNKQEKIKA